MLKRLATAGLIPAFIVSAALTVAFVAPAGAAKTVSSCGYGYTSCNCTSATISPTAPTVTAGSTINFTATSTGCPNPHFAWWLRYPNGTWRLLQSFSTSPNFSFNTNFFPPAHVVIRVWVNQVPSAKRYDRFADSHVTLTGCTGATLTQPSTSSAVGATVVFTATGTGCPNPIFAFFLKDTAGKWHLMQPFSVGTATWAWHPVGWAKGTYKIEVWANQAGSYVRVHQGAAVVTHTLT